MEKENKKKISLATYVVSLIIMLAIIVGLIFVIVRGDANKDVTGNVIGNLSSEENIIEDTSNKINSNIEYIKIQLEDTKADGLAHTNPVKINDENVISKLEGIINLGTEYEPKSTAWPDISPLITFGLENGETYKGFTASFINSIEEDKGNYITIFNNRDEEGTKITYKISTDLEAYVTNLYNQYKPEKISLKDNELDELTNYLNKVENNGFLLSSYNGVGEIDLEEVLYNGAGFAEEIDNDRSIEVFGELQHLGVREFFTDETIDFLEEKTGKIYNLKEELGDNFEYIEKFDAYYFSVGDTNYSNVTCISGIKEGDYYTIKGKLNDGTLVYNAEDDEDEFYYNFSVVLEKTENGYKFVKNILE